MDKISFFHNDNNKYLIINEDTNKILAVIDIIDIKNIPDNLIIKKGLSGRYEIFQEVK